MNKKQKSMKLLVPIIAVVIAIVISLVFVFNRKDTKEYDNTVVIWNHYIKMEEISQQVTRYTDTVDLYAGCLTSITAWWTLKFYKHRQRKWQKIAKSL